MQEKVSLERSPDWKGLISNRRRPDSSPAMYQTWHDLLFLHARVPRELLQSFVPPELEVEEYDGSGWLGLVPFSMSRIRPLWFPAVPWLSAFHETNLRTYVTHPKHGPGVWFFSLEATRYLGCFIARQTFQLPYFHANLSRRIEEDCWHYEGKRNATQRLPALPCHATDLKSYSLTVCRAGEWGEARPETFEFWLVERYRLYSLGKGNAIQTAKVFHDPYIVAPGELKDLRIDGLETQFGKLDFSSVLLAKTLNVECFSSTLASV